MALENIVDDLAKVPLFAHMPSFLRRQIVDHGAVEETPSGSTLFRHGDESCDVYVVLSGAIQLRGENDHPLREVQAGSTIGEAGVITGGPRSATAQATQDSQLLRIPKSHFDALLWEDEEFVFALLYALAELLRASQALVRPATPELGRP